MTHHPTEAHTCHDHCQCQPPGTEAQFLGHDADHICHTCSCVANERDQYERERDDARKERNTFADVADRLRSELAEAREDAKACAGQRDAAIFQADYWRDQLADMTAQRDRVEAKRDVETHRANAAELKWNEAEARANLYLKERDEALTERDDAIRSADAVAAERDAEAYERDRERVGREAAEAEREHLTGLLADVRETRDALAEQRNRRERELNTAQAEVKELREELEHWTSGRRRKGLPRVESVPDAVARAAEMVRSSYEGDLPDDIADVMRGNAHRMRVLHDAASTLRAERDALQARINRVVALAGSYAAQGEYSVNSSAVARDLRDALYGAEPAPPADDGSEATTHFTITEDEVRQNLPITDAEDESGCDCGICTHDEYSDISDAQHRGYVHGYRDGRAAGLVSKEPATSVNSDAENESPPFTVGQYVRQITGGEVGQVKAVEGTGRWVRWLDGSETLHDRGWLMPWRPEIDERVERITGAGKSSGGVVETYYDEPGREDHATVQESDYSEFVVPLSALRPAGGEHHA